MRAWGIALFCATLGFACAGSHEAAARQNPRGTRNAEPSHSASSGPRGKAHDVQRGHASIYAYSLTGRRMADGNRFDPHADTVASRTLPLGSRARVTNLSTGRSVLVRVTDRGPHIRHRILDVSPGVASRLGMGRTGTAMVSVEPVGLVEVAEASGPKGPR
ncbi:rare lipoprotein A [Roseomonas rosea]|uniref:Endolytic peptidoglycan transglycosylase RlpA n=1 Tax=Muricoccus roseus TaxID=198092 RepID=A0A1M6JL76_9PROT|nr:septal ring lytic transglycosylase RlpA family protein [Roseomonas rosea]SHJ47457.1 rare lipoprotein A [Roseomonas rosea]